MPRPLKYDKILYIRTNSDLIDHINKKAKIENISPTVYVRQVLEKEIIGKVLDVKTIKTKKNIKISDAKKGINNNDNSIQCNDSSALNNGSNVDCVYDWQVGCTDSYAFNFNPEAMYYNCSCFYSGTSYSEHVPGITGGCNWGDIGYSDGGMNSFWYIIK